jgi:hypothetical protein
MKLLQGPLEYWRGNTRLLAVSWGGAAQARVERPCQKFCV